VGIHRQRRSAASRGRSPLRLGGVLAVAAIAALAAVLLAGVLERRGPLAQAVDTLNGAKEAINDAKDHLGSGRTTRPPLEAAKEQAHIFEGLAARLKDAEALGPQARNEIAGFLDSLRTQRTSIEQSLATLRLGSSGYAVELQETRQSILASQRENMRQLRRVEAAVEMAQAEITAGFATLHEYAELYDLHAKHLQQQVAALERAEKLGTGIQQLAAALSEARQSRVQIVALGSSAVDHLVSRFQMVAEQMRTGDSLKVFARGS
jgi:hypothetical protein